MPLPFVPAARRWSVLLFVGMWGSSAFAGDPVRCTAVFAGPVSGCSLTGTWVAVSTARSAAKGERLAQERLSEMVHEGAVTQAARAAGTMAYLTAAPDVTSCRATVEERARVNCTPEPELLLRQVCIADLADESCYRGPPLDSVGTAWKVAEKARADICPSVDAWLVAQGADAAKRESCHLTCLRDATVRCLKD